VDDGSTTTSGLTVTDITLPSTGSSITNQSGIGFIVVLIGLAALMIARRRQPA
jgi:LPXTG-motif cell wall-anchored protein